MAVTFHFQKGADPEINIEDYFAIRITSVRGLNPPQPKELFKRDWAGENGTYVYIDGDRKVKSSEVTMTLLIEDSVIYLGMQVKANEKFREFCDYILNGLITYRDTLQNQSATLVYDNNKPLWYQFVGKGQLMAEITFLNPTGAVTYVEPSPPGVAPDITSDLTINCVVDEPFTYTITAGNDPTSFAAFGLPSGLSINTSTGVISGTPTAIAVSNIIISATNLFGNDLEVLVLTVESGAVLPIVLTLPVEDIVYNGATFGINITDQGSSSVTSRGWHFNQVGGGSSGTTTPSYGSMSGIFTMSWLSFWADTEYEYYAWATNSDGTYYGETLTFTTASAIPSVTTVSVANITSDHVDVTINISSQGASAVTYRGYQFQPVVGGSVASSEMGWGSLSGESTITGIFLPNPNTLYKIRATARNASGTAYGEWIEFTTLP